MRSQGLSEFVGLIYDTALDPDAWPTMLNRLADLLAATTGAHFGSYNSRTYVTTNLAPRLDPEYSRVYPEYWVLRSRLRVRNDCAPAASHRFSSTLRAR